MIIGNHENSAPARCECGKKWEESSGVVSRGKKRHHAPLGHRHRRRRAYSSGDSAEVVDLEDVFKPEDSSTLAAELRKAAPKLQLQHSELVEEEGARCKICHKSDCITIRPTVGYYTKEQVARHCTPDDCWIIAHGSVYDVTRYLGKHPGGAQSILKRAGGDASLDFDFHSGYAKRKLWVRYKIGRVAVCPFARESCKENCSMM